MSINTNDVKKIANLARLQFNDAELSAFTTDLSNILDFIEQINSARNLDNIEPMYSVIDADQPLRPDEVTEPNLRELFQKNAPETEAGLYLVPKVIEEAWDA